MDGLQMPALGSLMDGARAQAESVRLERLSAQKDDTAAGREALERTAKEFEGIFLNQLLKSMRATVPESELFNGGGASKFYRQMHDAELAKGLAGSRGGMGIAGLIVDQFDTAVDRENGPDKISRPTALSRYVAHGDAAYQARQRGELEAMARRAEVAEIDTLQRWSKDLQVASQRHEVPAALLLAVIMEESGGDPDAVSGRGARGLMQLMPATAQKMGVPDPSQPGPNIAGGARYLAEQLERFDGRLDLALAAYNAGPGAVEQAGRQIPDYAETRRYVSRVTARFHRLGGGTDLANGSE